MSVPTRQEINVYNSPDERSACEHFLGKNLDEAGALFRESSICYQEDLLFMGPVAFRYYVRAVIRYIESKEADNDSDIISCLAAILEHRLEYEQPEEFVDVAAVLASTCDYVILHYARFNLVPEIYGDIRPRYAALRERFVRLVS